MRIQCLFHTSKILMYKSPSDMICQLKRLTCELGLNDEVDIRIDWKIDLIETGYYGYHPSWIFCMIKYVVKMNPNIDIFWNLRDTIRIITILTVIERANSSYCWPVSSFRRFWVLDLWKNGNKIRMVRRFTERMAATKPAILISIDSRNRKCTPVRSVDHNAMAINKVATERLTIFLDVWWTKYKWGYLIKKNRS